MMEDIKYFISYRVSPIFLTFEDEFICLQSIAQLSFNEKRQCGYAMLKKPLRVNEHPPFLLYPNGSHEAQRKHGNKHG